MGFRRCPYEEGTERLSCVVGTFEWPSVSDAVPMKRELKAVIGSCGGAMRSSVSDAVPMKRELKVLDDDVVQLDRFCFRRCPYEEGTERACTACRSRRTSRFQTLSL